jgi:hypothetical protein
MSARFQITKLEMSRCEMKGQQSLSLTRVLVQRPALENIDLRVDLNFPAVGVERIGVLTQCTSLTHFDLRYNDVEITLVQLTVIPTR